VKRTRRVRPLPVGRQITEQHGISQRIAHRLLVRAPKHAHVEARGRRRIRHHDVQMLQTEILER
jgi:hypothetical protein